MVEKSTQTPVQTAHKSGTTIYETEDDAMDDLPESLYHESDDDYIPDDQSINDYDIDDEEKLRDDFKCVYKLIPRKGDGCEGKGRRGRGYKYPST